MEIASEQMQFDNQTVFSDITDSNETNTILSFVIEDKIDEIVQMFNAELNKLNNDGVKEKAKELGISGLSKLKKTDIIQLLEAEFVKLLPALKEKKATDLKNICKCYGIKGVTGVKKDVIIYNMLLYCCATLTFTLNNTQETEPDVCSKTEPMDLIEQLEKQKVDIEMKLKDEHRMRQDKRIEIEQKIKDELRLQEDKRMDELRIQEANEKKAKEELRVKEANEKKAKEDDEAAKLREDVKKKKQSIPKNVRIIIWNHYIGEDIIKHRCLCCKKVIISNTNFEVGHVISERNGGTHEINNLRPICFACNHSMGIENMIDFVVKYGLYIG